MTDGQRCYETYIRAMNNGVCDTIQHGWQSLPEDERQAWDAVADEMNRHLCSQNCGNQNRQ